MLNKLIPISTFQSSPGGNVKVSLLLFLNYTFPQKNTKREVARGRGLNKKLISDPS
jgi:hypothetical protein